MAEKKTTGRASVSLSRFRDLLPPGHGRAARQRAPGFPASELFQYAHGGAGRKATLSCPARAASFSWSTTSLLPATPPPNGLAHVLPLQLGNGGELDLRTMNADGSQVRQLRFNDGIEDDDPVGSSDGK